VLSLKMLDPQFSGQTKERLSSRECAPFVSGVAKDSNVPGTIIDDTASLTYTSLNGAIAGERSGGDGVGGALNNYALTASAPTVVTVGYLDVTKVADKKIVATNQIVTYTVTVTVAEGTTTVILDDTMPVGLEFVPNSALLNLPAGWTITGFNPDSVDQILTITNPGNVDGAATLDVDSFTLTYKARVQSAAETPGENRIILPMINDLDASADLNNDGDTTDGGERDLDNQATVTGIRYLYDGFNNFAQPEGEDEEWWHVGKIDVYRDAILPIAPIYSGAAEPGSTLEVVIYAANGNVVGRQTVIVDTGGSWMASFAGTKMREYPQSVVITQTPASSASEQGGGYNMRPYYATAINAGHFFREQLNVTRISTQTASNTVDALTDALENPLEFGESASAYETIAVPGHPSGR
jgi:uncharacterized repeat protein (TIGR01451 family)